MNITRLRAAHYRNLVDCDFAPGDGVNVIYGQNAQGKTNLLEAIWLFCGQKSFRGSRDSQLVREGQPAGRLDLDFFAREREQTVSFLIEQTRTATLNGVKCAGPSELMGRFCAVVFSPDHLTITKDGPAERRRFLDVALAEVRPGYAANLREYRLLLAQRKACLDSNFSDGALLEVYEDALAQRGGATIHFRRRYMDKLAVSAAAFYRELSGDRETLDVKYRPAGVRDVSLSREQITEQLRGALRESREEDTRLGRAGVGPHRDNFDIEISGRSARLYGSQGQQRSAVLSLKLAEAALLKEVLREPPVILLDDVMSELDSDRQRYILQHLSEGQVFITCADARQLEGGQYHRFEMVNGVCTPRE